MGVGGIDPVFIAVLAIIVFLVLIADLVIFCYWFSFKYKEYSFQQMYGPILKFPPRESDHPSDYPPQPTLVIDPYSPDEAIPDSQYPTPDDHVSRHAERSEDTEGGTPNAERSTPNSVPTFDFMPPVATDNTVAIETSDELTTPIAPIPSTEYQVLGAATPDAELIPNTQYPIPDDATPNAERPTPNTAQIPNTQYPIPEAATPDAAQILNTRYPIPTTADAFEDTRPIDPMLLSAQGGVRSPFAATWSLVHPFVGIQFVLIVVSILQVIFLLPAMFSSGPNAMTSPYGLTIIIVTLFIQNAGFVGITAYLVKGYGASLKRIGLRAPTVREIGLGLVYGAGLCVAAVLMEKALDAGATHFVSKQFIDRMGKLNDALTAGAQFEKIRSVPLQIWFILAGAVAAPIGEEVFFRGLLYNGLKKRWGVTAGVIVSGICFGLIHFAPEAIIIIIPMGCILAMVYERTKSLWVTILMHAVNNGSQLIIAMYAMNHLAGHK